MASIRRGLLSDLFVGVAAKTLSLVETDPKKSNQHEFNGSRELKNLFGLEPRQGIPTRFIWLADEQMALSEDGFLSWSKYREGRFLYGKPRAIEYRLYYSGNAVTAAMETGDTLFIAMRPRGQALVIIAPSGTTMQSQLRWLFGMSEQGKLGFEYNNIEQNANAQIDFAARYILDELGLDIEEPEADWLDALLEPFGMLFPNTKEFSEFSRNSLTHISPHDDPDKVLMAWLEREQLLFRRLERRIVAKRLEEGFIDKTNTADIEGFLSFSLHVQNRRKSRAGQSFEHHLEKLFNVRGIHYQRGIETENRNRPDFLFPGQKEYRNEKFPVERLTMLGAKSTLKDRWRQVLSEARRIEFKHLITLEPSISERQTDQMNSEKLQLILPQSIHATFKKSQHERLMNVQNFIDLVIQRQKS